MIVKTFNQVAYGLATLALLAVLVFGAFILLSRTAPPELQTAAPALDSASVSAVDEEAIAADTVTEEVITGSNTEIISVEDSAVPVDPGVAVSIPSFDRLELKGSFYPSPTKTPAPGVILVHGPGQDRYVWNDMVLQLNDRGYAVLTVDGRGFGETGGPPAHQRMADDVLAIWHNFSDRPEVDEDHTFIIGVGQSADKIFEAGTKLPDVQGMVLISPSYAIADEYTMAAKFGVILQALIIASEEDTARVGAGEALVAQSPAAALQTFAGNAYGMSILQQQPESKDFIINWLDEQINGN